MSRVVIVSNRLPVTVKVDGGAASIVDSAGGLATALRGPHARTEGLWIGWPGDVSRLTDAERAEVDARLAAARMLPVHLTASEVAHYYDGFSNGVMWPLLHYQIERVRFEADYDFKVYEEVNRRFAHAIAAQVRADDLVWVHDYQLALVPRMLRELVPGVRIGFFLHVPFPSPDVFRTLPWDAEILHGMLGADLVGFHTDAYRRNFVQTVHAVLGHDIETEFEDETTLVVDGRDVVVAVRPIGVDVGYLEELAASEEVEREAARIREDARGKKILLGVDRLDYTKGIPRRLMAFDRLLDRHPRLKDKVLFVQLAVPTREKVDDYADLRRRVNETAGRVNAHHGSPTGAPISLMYRSIPMVQLLALYRAADVMLVTPLRDGMNLVAKEYVASRVDGRGVLVLSEFAGAADELTEALLVNPYHLGAVSSAMRAAIEMPLDEQARRMSALRSVVASQDVGRWVDRFLRRLSSCDRPSLAPSEIRPMRDVTPTRLRVVRSSGPPR